LVPGAKVYVGIQYSYHGLFSEDHGGLLVEIIWRKRLTDISFNYGYGAKVSFDGTWKNLQRNDHGKMKELRKNPRQPLSKPTYFTSQNKYYKGLIKNISRGGAFIQTKVKFSNKQKLKFVIPSAKKHKVFMLKGEIIHLDPKGFGLKFKGILKIGKSLGTNRH
jgi:hypothetical protein